MIKTKTLVLFSGGIDSTATIDYFLRQQHEVMALFVDYGQLSVKQESEAVLRTSLFYQIPLNSIGVTGISKALGGYIRGRNAFLLYTALMSFPFEAGIISLGVHSSTSYPDCSEYFINQIQDSFDIYANGTIKIHAPFATWKKAEIWQYCLDNGVPLELTYSCELGEEQPCGRCLSCHDLERLNVS